MHRPGLLVALLVAFSVGLFVGYAVRAWRYPTMEERTDEAAKTLHKALKNLTR
jgi:hypothetical protein